MGIIFFNKSYLYPLKNKQLSKRKKDCFVFKKGWLLWHDLVWFGMVQNEMEMVKYFINAGWSETFFSHNN